MCGQDGELHQLQASTTTGCPRFFFKMEKSGDGWSIQRSPWSPPPSSFIGEACGYSAGRNNRCNQQVTTASPWQCTCGQMLLQCRGPLTEGSHQYPPGCHFSTASKVARTSEIQCSNHELAGCLGKVQRSCSTASIKTEYFRTKSSVNYCSNSRFTADPEWQFRAARPTQARFRW